MRQGLALVSCGERHGKRGVIFFSELPQPCRPASRQTNQPVNPLTLRHPARECYFREEWVVVRSIHPSQRNKKTTLPSSHMRRIVGSDNVRANPEGVSIRDRIGRRPGHIVGGKGKAVIRSLVAHWSGMSPYLCCFGGLGPLWDACDSWGGVELIQWGWQLSCGFA